MKKNRLTWCMIVAVVAFGVKAQAAEWETDFAKASESAAKTGRYMLLDFSGSDWCGWCMKLDKEVFSVKEFTDFAEKNLVCVQLDFPRQKELDKALQEQNAKLARKYKLRGYPTIIILSPEGDLVETTGYKEGGAQKYVDSIKDVIAKYEIQHPRKEVKSKLESGEGK